MQSRPQTLDTLRQTAAYLAHWLAAQNRDEELEKRKKVYLALILLAFHESLDSPDRFIRRLKTLNTVRLRGFALFGYREARGMMPDVPLPYRDAASAFVNAFVEQFREDLKRQAGTMDYERRALMYGETGYRMAFLQGIQAAMRERGATHWRRVLHPEASKSGPCPLCVADAEKIHPIEEPFVALHPNEMCTMSPITLQFTGAAGAVEYGIPGFTENQITPLLRELYGEIENNVERSGM